MTLGVLPSATLDRMRDPGAPVELYRLLEAAGEPELIDREIPGNAEILELGCGSGRITHPLVALGRRVVAVDFNQEMLDLIEGPKRSCRASRIWISGAHSVACCS